MKRIFLIIALLMASSSPAVGNIEAYGEYRLGIENSRKFTNLPLLFSTELNAHFSGMRQAFSEGKVQVSLGYEPNSRLQWWIGYEIRPEIPKGQSSFEFEHRLSQQLHWQIAPRVTWRNRLVQRYSNKEGVIAWRLQERVAYQLLSATACRPQVTVSEELYLDINHPAWVGNKLISQNRLVIAADFPFIQSTTFNIGYLNKYQFDEPVDKMRHILFMLVML